MALYNQNISFWHEDLKEFAITLVKDEKLWVYDEQNATFNPGVTMEGLDLKEKSAIIKKFKIVSNVGLEILTKSVCVKRKIDIFKEQKSIVKQKSPFGIANVVAPENDWLSSMIQTHDYTHLGDINTIEFCSCINKLKKNLKQTDGSEKYTQLMDDIDEWRRLHRNIEVHISLPVILLDDYETELRKLYNGLLEIYNL